MMEMLPLQFEWRTCRVGIDYHVEVAAHYYSVPHRFVRAEVDARLTVRTVEIFLKGERIAAHVHASGKQPQAHTPCSRHSGADHVQGGAAGLRRRLRRSGFTRSGFTGGINWYRNITATGKTQQVATGP
jgi:hypothetical protein